MNTYSGTQKRTHILYHKHTPERVLELDVKSQELTQKRESEKHTLAAAADTHITFNADKQAHTLSSLTVSPRCITLSGMQGGGSPHQAHLNARSQERLLCCVFATRDSGREIVCVTHLDLFWHTNNYSCHLLQVQLNVASKVLKIKTNFKASPSDDD